jgi:hypothetical protein
MDETTTETTHPCRRTPIAVRAAVAAALVTAFYRLRRRRRAAASAGATR